MPPALTMIFRIAIEATVIIATVTVALELVARLT